MGKPHFLEVTHGCRTRSLFPELQPLSSKPLFLNLYGSLPTPSAQRPIQWKDNREAENSWYNVLVALKKGRQEEGNKAARKMKHFSHFFLLP